MKEGATLQSWGKPLQNWIWMPPCHHAAPHPLPFTNDDDDDVCDDDDDNSDDDDFDASLPPSCTTPYTT